MPRIVSRASRHDEQLYTQGECHVFALALHREFGWAIELVLDQGERFWEDPSDADNWIPSVVHAYAVDGEGQAWDVLGVRPLDEVRAECDGLYHVREHDTETLSSEKDLAAWCGCHGEPWDGEAIERPLFTYSETDVAEALEAARRALDGLPGFPARIPGPC